MEIIQQWSTEREGNDSWLRYILMIYEEWDEVTFQLKENHDGHAGPLRDSRSFHLDPHKITGEMLDHIIDYVDDFSEHDEHKFQMINNVEQAIHHIGLDRGNLWFEMSNALRHRFLISKRHNGTKRSIIGF